jgi:predicted glutamine amidotransferase
MCRLFAQISPEPKRAAEFLVQTEYALLKQSGLDPNRPQKDGWGIGHFENGKAIVIKSCLPAYEEPQSVKKAADQAISKTIVGHIRAATNPRGIDPKNLLTEKNSQPFENGEWIFAHNGTIQIPDEIAERLGPLKNRIASLSDSEIYFWQFIKFVKETGNPTEAFMRCVEELWDVWKECGKKYPDKTAPYTSLNAVVANENSLYAFCHAAITPQPDQSLCRVEQPWYTLNFSERSGTLIVASEGLDREQWSFLAPPEILSAQISGANLNISRNKYVFKNGKIIRIEETTRETVKP